MLEKGDIVTVYWSRVWKSRYTPMWADRYQARIIRVNRCTYTVHLLKTDWVIRVDMDDVVKKGVKA